ncbi:MAG: hypothetical protein ACFE0Q_08350 [Anaerolineae bacterium]
MSDQPQSLLEITRELIHLRKKPTTQVRFKSYPSLLQAFIERLQACDDPDVLHEVLHLDSGYYLLAGYRQQVLEKLLEMHRTAPVLRLYAMQLELFGDVDEYGEANLDTDARVDALHAEADALDER